MKKTPIKNKKNQKGFTLLETLVAIFILTLSITGPVYIASVAFRNTIDSRDNISAQYLAEEVIEVLRNNRDAKSLDISDGGTSLDGITGPGIDCFNDEDLGTNKCIMKRSSLSDNGYIFEQCNVDSECSPITFDPENNDIVYGSTAVTGVSKFTREFYFEKFPHDSEVKLVVNIKWTDKGKPKIYTLNQRLYTVNYRDFFKPDTDIIE